MTIQTAIVSVDERPVAYLDDEVVAEMDLEIAPCGSWPGAVILHGADRPVAALVQQAGSFREDRLALQAIKRTDQTLPIIYIARNLHFDREAAIRRIGIHYFFAAPVESEELRLVLADLVRSSSSGSCFERFFSS